MNRETFDKLVENYDPKDEILVSKMALLIEKYPYFQLPRFFYTKSLKDQNKNNLDIALNQLALYTSDRSVLKQNIESKFELIKNGDPLAAKVEPPSENKEIPAEKPKKATEPKEEYSSKNTSKQRSKPKVKQTEKANVSPLAQKKPQMPLKEKAVKKLKPQPKKSENISEDLKMSFLDWIQYTEENQNIEPIISEKKDPLSDKLPIIDRFIETDPKILPLGKSETIESLPKQDFNSEELMTETLAKVLVKQKKYKKAMSAYKILSLKYPEKNVFFAGQIQKLKKLQQQ
tara:strand:- start:988 stop:1851 length:864 start_codon:yes stop_codon:yes gene_type:complete